MATAQDKNPEKIGEGDYLEFEQKVADFDRQMEELRRLSSIKGIDYSAEIRQIQLDQVAELKSIYSQLNAWQTVQVADGWVGWWQPPSTDREAPDYYAKFPNSCSRDAPAGCVAWHNPEFRDTAASPQDPPRIRSGQNSQKYFTFWSVH